MSSRCDVPGHADLEGLMSQSGAYRFGIAAVEPVDGRSAAAYDQWIAAGCHDTMDYLDRYADVRRDPSLLLEGARSMIVAAFPYAAPVLPGEGKLRFAAYALGDDYHEVLRRRLEGAAEVLRQRWGGLTRVCVDTAPLRERYWAVRAGLGFIGLNCQLILPGAGSYFFIGTILSTVDMTPDAPCRLSGAGCRRCVVYSPGQALDGNPSHPSLDARRCLSCLTIEHRGPLPSGVRLGRRVYGCDTCQIACPHNRMADPVRPLPEFEPRPELLELTRDDLLSMDQQRFSTLFRHSAIKRAKLAGLQRNALSVEPD